MHLSSHAVSKKPVAVKVLPKQRPKLSRSKVVEKLAREVHILQKLQPCPRVVALEGCYEDHDSVAVVTEACMGGDLQKYSDVSLPVCVLEEVRRGLQEGAGAGPMRRACRPVCGGLLDTQGGGWGR